MEQAFYRDRLAAHGITAIIPDAADRATVHNVIYEELVRGVVTEESRQAYREVIGRLVDAGAEGIILGCTEIELLIRQADSPVPVFPTTALHVDAALAAAGLYANSNLPSLYSTTRRQDRAFSEGRKPVLSYRRELT